MKQPSLPAAVLIGSIVAAMAQDTPGGKRPTAGELEEAHKEGASAALADAKKGRFVMDLIHAPNAPWLGHWLDLVPKRGFILPPPLCGVGVSEYDLVRSDAYDAGMLREIKRKFGDDIFDRLNAEAKARYEAKQAPKPSMPNVRSAKPKKRGA